MAVSIVQYAWIITAISISAVKGQTNIKLWLMNTNFDNIQNWGSAGDCSKDIYQFLDSADPYVASLYAGYPIKAQEIIFPRNGHFILQPGAITFLNAKNDTCSGVELKFQRTSREDWLNPHNWLDQEALGSWDATDAIPHVERSPCQYDIVVFPFNSAFYLVISSDVTVHKFLLGDQELAYNDIAILMTTQLGKIQFKKKPETLFSLGPEWQDNDKSICKNFQPEIKQRICSFVVCVASDYECPNPIQPHGFCCPICGFHLKIKHNGNLILSPIRTKIQNQLNGIGKATPFAVHATRIAEGSAHVVFISGPSSTKELKKFVKEILNFVKQDPTVLDTDVIDSWHFEDGGSDSLTSSGGHAGLIVFILLFVCLAIGGAVFLLFFWDRRGQGPTLTLNSVLSRMARVTIPIPSFNPRRPSFTFARFSNERVSSVNIGQLGTGALGRTERVDSNVTSPIDVELPETVAGSTSGGLGFANVLYDIVGVGGGASGEMTVPPPDGELNKGGSPLKEINEESVYDLVEVNGGGPTGSMDFGPTNVNVKAVPKEE